MRECCDSDEHPDTLPVILALDVTGSMGGALLKTAASLNVIMQKILDEYEDVEFMVMGIGDLSYDRAPIQISQFESDIRIAEHLDRLWFERGGGGNSFESYTAAWYMGLYHTSLDCWKKGRKGILITLGDEPLILIFRQTGSRRSQETRCTETWIRMHCIEMRWKNMRFSTLPSMTGRTAIAITQEPFRTVSAGSSRTDFSSPA
jgi:hypothetical protein